MRTFIHRIYAYTNVYLFSTTICLYGISYNFDIFCIQHTVYSFIQRHYTSIFFCFAMRLFFYTQRTYPHTYTLTHIRYGIKTQDFLASHTYTHKKKYLPPTFQNCYSLEHTTRSFPSLEHRFRKLYLLVPRAHMKSSFYPAIH